MCPKRRWQGEDVERREVSYPIGHGFRAVVRLRSGRFAVASWHSGHGCWNVAARTRGFYSHHSLGTVLAELDVERGGTLAEAREEVGLCPRCGSPSCADSVTAPAEYAGAAGLRAIG